MEVLTSQKVVVSESYNLWNMSDPDQARQAKETEEGLQDFVGAGQSSAEPAVELYVPVVDIVDPTTDYFGTTFAAPTPTSNSSTVNSTSVKDIKVVAVLAVSIFWYHLIQDILPANNDGVIVVFENTCGQRFTYMINGPYSVYLGIGDLHDPQYDDMVVSATLKDLSEFTYNDRKYTGPDLSNDFCPYSVNIYPSTNLASEYLTSNPRIFTLIFDLNILFYIISVCFICMCGGTTATNGIKTCDAFFSTSIIIVSIGCFATFVSCHRWGSTKF